MRERACFEPVLVKYNPRFTVVKLTRQNKPPNERRPDQGSLELSEIINTSIRGNTVCGDMSNGCVVYIYISYRVKRDLEERRLARQMEQPNYPMLRLIRRSRVIRLVSPSSGETFSFNCAKRSCLLLFTILNFISSSIK